MKKISYPLISLILFINIFACAGYNPIFSSSNLKFKIEEYSISGDQKFGYKIYSKLYNLSRSSETTPNTKNIYIKINSSQKKDATAKNTAGKVLGYRISVSTTITISDYLTEKEILSDSFSFSSTYKVQDQFSETVKLEKQIIENLAEKTYQDLLIKFSENIL